jgi:fluoride exporter
VETITKIVAVGIGGSLGAIARYLISISPLADLLGRFPLPTFLINISGSFVIGFLLVLFSGRYADNEALRLTLIVGFLGAFTTFSTFEAEIYALMQERETLTALAYLLLSVVLGFVGIAAGAALAKQLG